MTVWPVSDGALRKMPRAVGKLGREQPPWYHAERLRKAGSSPCDKELLDAAIP